MPIVGILGGGQLGRMLALAGYPLGLGVRVLEASLECSAGQVAPLVPGAYDDPAALERFALDLEVATYEFENVPVEAARRLGARVPVHPTPDALEIAQDRLREKRFLRELGIATTDFEAVDSPETLAAGVRKLGTPAVLKTRMTGYDGKGQAVVRDEADLPAAWQQVGGVRSILEAHVPFTRELSLIAVRGRQGALAAYPLIENGHEGGILRWSRAPAPDVTPALQTRAEAMARAIVERLDYVGVLAIELFAKDGELLVNELAPRVHNSGHWTIEGAETSQFENHLRAILGLPLGTVAPRGHSAMVNLIGSPPATEAVLGVEGAHLHLYGKAPRPGRKVGHVTVRCADPATRDQALAGLRNLAAAAG